MCAIELMENLKKMIDKNDGEDFPVRLCVISKDENGFAISKSCGLTSFLDNGDEIWLYGDKREIEKKANELSNSNKDANEKCKE